MSLIAQVRYLIHKEMLLEWRSKYALNSILLYVISTVFVCYQTFRSLDPGVWNALFWIILLFASINAISKSFTQEGKGRHLYYYSLASPQAIILSKTIYNILLMLLLAAVAFIVYSIIFRNPLGDPLLYLLAVFIGSISFASVFTMVSSISAKANNSATLMAILSFPVIIPVLLVLIRLSKNAVNGMERAASIDDIIVLFAINTVVITVSLLLFPYIWRD